MRRIVKWMCVVFLIAAAFTAINTAPASAGKIVSMALNGSNVAFEDQQPFVDLATGRTMIPLRTVAEKMGAQVTWDNANNSAVIRKDGTTITMQVGSLTPVVNGTKKHLDAPAALIDGRVMVPVRFVSEAMGCNVVWDGNNNCVNVTTDGTAASSVQTAPAVQTASAVQTAPVVQTAAAVQAAQDGMLPDEDKIQKSLTQEDIERLQSYPGKEEAKYGKHFEVFINPKHAETKRITPLFLQALKIMQDDVWTVDYEKLEDPSFAENYARNFYSISEKSDANQLSAGKYIADAIYNKLKFKAYLLSSNQVMYHATPRYIGVRTKYIFYQDSGSKIAEAGSTLKKWYWQDVELLFVVPATPWEGNTVGVAYDGFRNLNNPQPYFE